MTVLCTFEDGTQISRETNFDDWQICVNGRPRRDIDYLTELQQLSQTYGIHKVYNDFVVLYNNTHFSVDNDIFNILIPGIANNYNQFPTDNLLVRKLFSELYAVMLAEQNRFYDENVIPAKKKIKRLAVYQVLFLGFTPYQAAQYSRGNKQTFLADLHRLICTNGQGNAYCNAEQPDYSDCKYNIFGRGQLIVQLCHVYGF